MRRSRVRFLYPAPMIEGSPCDCPFVLRLEIALTRVAVLMPNRDTSQLARLPAPFANEELELGRAKLGAALFRTSRYCEHQEIHMWRQASCMSIANCFPSMSVDSDILERKERLKDAIVETSRANCIARRT